VFTQRFVCKIFRFCPLKVTFSVGICLSYSTCRAAVLGTNEAIRIYHFSLEIIICLLWHQFRRTDNFLNAVILVMYQLTDRYSTLLYFRRRLHTAMLRIQCLATTHLIMVQLAAGAWELDELWRSDTNNNIRDKLAQQLTCEQKLKHAV